MTKQTQLTLKEQIFDVKIELDSYEKMGMVRPKQISDVIKKLEEIISMQQEGIKDIKNHAVNFKCGYLQLGDKADIILEKTKQLMEGSNDE